MKLFLNQLPQHLTKSLEGLYIVYGDEPLLIQETIDQIRKRAMNAGFTEFIRFIPEAGSEWSSTFFEKTQSYSLFSSKRVIELDLTLAKFNATTSQILQKYAAHPSPDIILIIRAHKLDSKTEQTQWYKALDKVSVMISIRPIPAEQLPAWITQRAKTLGITLSNSATELLATLVEGNLLAAAQELEKLSLLQLNETIEPHHIEETVSDHAQFDIFSLVDHALAGNNKQALRILDNLIAEDVEATLVLWAITRELRTLTEIIHSLQQGTQLSLLFSKFRVWDKRQSAVRAFTQRHPLESCWEFIKNAAMIDRLIKGVENGNAWNAMRELVLNMTRHS